MARRLPVALEDEYALALDLATIGWSRADECKYGAAWLAYKIADDLLPYGAFDADLSLLRHRKGSARGLVVNRPSTEDRVYCIHIRDELSPEQTNNGMQRTEIDADSLERNIARFMSEFDPGFHRANITRDLPHVLVMSTGRCGTMSVYQLLEGSNVVPYHTYWWQNSMTARIEMMCRLISGVFRPAEPIFREWLMTRAAEWLGCISNNRVMIGLNHMDTIAAPAFMAVHPKAKLVHLRRNPKDVFKSFYSKGQWLGNQLCPLDYSFDPFFKYHVYAQSEVDVLKWYIRFTDAFARAAGRVMGNRYIEISSDKLFAQDESEIGTLIDFIGADIPIREATEHFGTKINEKAHKVVRTDREVNAAL